MEVEIRLAKGEYFQTHPSCVPEICKGSLIEIQTFRLGIFPLARASITAEALACELGPSVTRTREEDG